MTFNLAREAGAFRDFWLGRLRVLPAGFFADGVVFVDRVEHAVAFGVVGVWRSWVAGLVGVGPAGGAQDVDGCGGVADGHHGSSLMTLAARTHSP